MSRIYQEAHVLENLTTTVKNLQAQTADLVRSRGIQEEKIKNLTTANAALLAKNEQLELRMKANEHNTSARLANLSLHVGLPSTTPDGKPVPQPALVPLWDTTTGRPMRNFPKHERDIKTMGQAEVIQCLQSLGVKTLGMAAAGGGASEKKARLRREIGLPPVVGGG